MAPDVRTPSLRAPRQARAKQRVEQILDAARALVLTRGFAGLKMAEIAQTAGVTTSSIYQYFPHKRAIVLHLAQRHLEVGQRAMQALIDPRPETIDAFGLRLDAAVESYYLELRGDPLIPHLRSAFAADAELRALEARDTQLLEAQLLDGCEHLFRPDRLAQVRLAFRLFTEFLSVGIDMALALDEHEGRAVMDQLYINLDACWEVSILPHALEST